MPAGFQVYYTRGANNIGNLVIGWSYMGFIVNENDSAEGRMYPYFVEKERNHDRFVPAAVAVGHPINQLVRHRQLPPADELLHARVVHEGRRRDRRVRRRAAG